MDSFELELRQGFLEEAAQLLQDAEQSFLALEKSLETSGDVRGVIENIFRLAHNFKGSSRAVGFNEMADFSHVFESYLLKIKNGEIPVTTAAVSLLLRCNDQLCRSVESLKNNPDASLDSSALLAELRDRIEGRAPTEETAPEPVVEVPPGTAFDTQSAAGSEAPEADPEDEAWHAALAMPAETPTPAQTEPQPQPQTQTPQKQSPTAQPGDESIRVSLSKVEKLINNVGELVIMQTVLSQHRFQVEHPLIRKTIEEVSKVTKELQDISMSLRMIPLKQTFQKMQRIVRDTSKQLGKDVNLVLSGEETELDKTVLENLGDPLVHLVRNAVDHGLEPNAERLKLGKPAAGTITLSAYHRGASVVIEVREDGRGLDAERIRLKAIEKGVIRADQNLSEDDCRMLIFAPGFSTKSEVSDISGRGVGLDVVKTNVEKLMHGEIQVETVLGKGTTFRILLPLTMAIIDGMIIRLAEERYVIPLEHVHETLKPTRESIAFATGLGAVLSLRGEELPLYPLSYLLQRKLPKAVAPWDTIAMVVRSGERPFAILVDDILGEQQVVVKRLGFGLQQVRGFSGGAILGDGRAAVILDMVELAGRVASLGVMQKEIVGWA